VLLKLFRVCPETTRDRLWTARTGFFVLYPVFKEHLETRGSPGTRQSHRTDPGGGGGALNPTQRFDPIGPAAGRVLTLRR
jgi:hypothetical protein